MERGDERCKVPRLLQDGRRGFCGDKGRGGHGADLCKQGRDERGGKMAVGEHDGCEVNACVGGFAARNWA
ncbi:hypothetical protein SDC9_174237 [bioreactor metagenome]|uniref:Uncharacterized protein n=1 Tax=bioreactor metagenome TaxID=1076179 RepID=A0A645GLR7_9ZZZZ